MLTQPPVTSGRYCLTIFLMSSKYLYHVYVLILQVYMIIKIMVNYSKLFNIMQHVMTAQH